MYLMVSRAIDDCREQQVANRGVVWRILQVKIDFSQLHSITTDEEFCRQLYAEQSVLCIPGTAFQLPGYFRVVLSLPGEMLREALERVGMLCENYARK